MKVAWDKNSVPEADRFSSVPYLIDKSMVRERISKTTNEKSAGPSGLVSEMVKSAGKAGI